MGRLRELPTRSVIRLAASKEVWKFRNTLYAIVVRCYNNPGTKPPPCQGRQPLLTRTFEQHGTACMVRGLFTGFKTCLIDESGPGLEAHAESTVRSVLVHGLLQMVSLVHGCATPGAPKRAQIYRMWSQVAFFTGKDTKDSLCGQPLI